jgi:hypothetical protein
MSVRAWHPAKTCYCHHVNEEVSLEVEAVYPAEWLPDQPPRLLAHRCSHALQCNLEGRYSCVWSGTNPVIDPFIEKLV